jgi:hypothetical protein
MNRKDILFLLSISLVLIISQFIVRDFDDRYGRSINGDGKGYYAYLPAIFIYQDPSYQFIHNTEKKYYPEDGSQFKDFLNKQRNGKFVNKTFPGLSVLYAPFFAVSHAIAWTTGYETDGYSAPYQWGIAFSHIVYYLLGWYFLFRLFAALNVDNRLGWLLMLSVTFGTNCWYYLVYDHSVSHIHSFFLACTLLYLMQKFIDYPKSFYLGWLGIVLALIVITRPTNAIMLMFFPFLLNHSKRNFWELEILTKLKSKDLIPYYLVGVALLLFPFVLWKWQSDLWLVYSYNEEGFNFFNPRLFDFLFSFQKGWLLWSPLIFFGLIYSCVQFYRESKMIMIYYLLPIGASVYVLSSWWCWTYGTGFGQRPMIEFIPFIVLGCSLALNKIKTRYLAFLLVVPFSALSMFQSFQVANSILIGGETTASDYFNHFLQWKRDAPKVNIPIQWQLISSDKISINNSIDKNNPYSNAIELANVGRSTHVLISVRIAGNHGDRETRIVVADSSGTFYKTIFIGDFLYPDFETMEFLIDLPNDIKGPVKCYIWNGDTATATRIDWISIKCYSD